MEAYFHSDPRIEEWINQITEKIFTVCLLTGADSEVEYQSGCQIVTEVTHLLQGISMFPAEYLEDGLKQLLEQQLPDARVINNFPTFQDTMNKMLREGMTRAINSYNKEDMKSPAFSKKDTPENTTEESKDNTGKSANLLNDEFTAEEVITALASVKSKTANFGEATVKLPALKLDELMGTTIVPQPSGILLKTLVPEQADRLKYVLSIIFPNVSVCWNLDLMGQSFLAQVEDILICLHNPEQPCPVENFNKEGWKVYVCSSNDLMFPRRLERGIRQIQRLSKQWKSG